MTRTMTEIRSQLTMKIQNDATDNNENSNNKQEVELQWTPGIYKSKWRISV